MTGNNVCEDLNTAASQKAFNRWPISFLICLSKSIFLQISPFDRPVIDLMSCLIFPVCPFVLPRECIFMRKD